MEAHIIHEEYWGHSSKTLHIIQITDGDLYDPIDIDTYVMFYKDGFAYVYPTIYDFVSDARKLSIPYPVMETYYDKGLTYNEILKETQNENI